MSNTQTDIDYFLRQNNINLEIKIIDDNIIYISNENSDQFYQIFIKKYVNNVDIDVIRNVVRHDDSIVSHKQESINTSFSDLYTELQKYNIIDNDKLTKITNYIAHIF